MDSLVTSGQITWVPIPNEMDSVAEAYVYVSCFMPVVIPQNLNAIMTAFELCGICCWLACHCY